MLAQLAGYYTQRVSRATVINALFGAGEQGALYDPSDLSTMYQDVGVISTGAVPVTADNQPVGLSLDLSQHLVLGSELVTNGTFDTDVAGWSAIGALSWDAGAMRATADGASPGVGYQALTLTVGKTYVLRYEVIDRSQDQLRVRVGDGPTSTSIFDLRPFAVGEYEARFKAATATTYISFGYGSTTSGLFSVWDNISVRELPGHHALAPNSASRPLVRDNPWRIDYDGVDDYLRTVFPDLGANCTVGRAVPGVGAVILTGQTINGNYDDSTDHAGLVVVDRALTGDETVLLTKWLNQQAGV